MQICEVHYDTFKSKDDDVDDLYHPEDVGLLEIFAYGVYRDASPYRYG